jgi:hypothetical protein
LLWVLLSETIILAWTHRADLRHLPRLRDWLARRISTTGDRR